MTTLVYRDGILAADSRGTCCGWIANDDTQKVFKRDGMLFGICGDPGLGLLMVNWLLRSPLSVNKDPPDLDEESRVVMVIAGSVRVYEGKNAAHYICDGSPGHYYAWGSGMPTALAALHMGASAEQAVQIAMRVDPNTGGEVRSVSL